LYNPSAKMAGVFAIGHVLLVPEEVYALRITVLSRVLQLLTRNNHTLMLDDMPVQRWFTSTRGRSDSKSFVDMVTKCVISFFTEPL